MSHTDDIPQREARRHKPAIIAIIVALIVAGLAILFFGVMGGDDAATRELAPGTSDTAPAATAPDAAAAPAAEPAAAAAPETAPAAEPATAPAN